MLIQEQFSDPKIYHHTFKLQNIKLQNWPQISIFLRKGQPLATFTHGPWSKDNFMHFFIVSWKVSYWMRIFKNVGKWFYGLSNITLFTLHRTVQFKKKIMQNFDKHYPNSSPDTKHHHACLFNKINFLLRSKWVSGV